MVRETKNVDIAELVRLAGWLDEENIKSIEIFSPGRSLRIVMEGRIGGLGPTNRMASAHVGANGDPLAVPARTPGVFLAAHPCRTEPLVQSGAKVAAGDIVGLLKVGHILIPVAAPRDGIVTRVLAAPGTTVDFGASLVEIRPSASISVHVEAEQ